MATDVFDRAFKQSLCESRQVLDNLDPASARLINELQRQLTKVKGELATEKHKCRSMARDHLVELKRLREEHERRLESSLEALNSRKDQEKAVELKRVEENLVKRRENEVKFLNKDKADEIKALERRLQRKAEENLRLALERQRREIYEVVEAARIPDEQESAKRESKLMKEVFDLGEENMKLEDQVRNLTNENRSQIEQLRRAKQEHKAEIDHILRQTKIDASRDMARLKLAEQVIQERDTDLMEICQRAEIAEQEREQLEAEVTVLKIVHENDKPNSEPKKPASIGNAAILKKVEDLEASLRKLEEEKLNLKQENAALRKKLVQGGDPDTKSRKESEDEIKRLRKRTADLSGLVKTMDDRVQMLKMENKRVQEKQINESADVEQTLRKTLSRQHAKDISEYTRKIASKDREILEIKRRLSKYEVSSDARHEPASELDKKIRMMAMERIKMEKLMSKLYNEIPDPSDIEISYRDICSEMTRLQELSDENTRLRIENHELKKPSEVDGSRGRGKANDHTSDLEVVRDLREENQRLQTELQELSAVAEENKRLAKELNDSEIATSTADKRLKLLQEDLEQARLLSQEYERAREHCSELETEVAEARGQLNEKDRELCQMELEINAKLAMIQEKEEEVDMLKETVCSLKNELKQNEDLVKELQKEIEVSNLPPDLNHIGLQTSPLVTPKMYPQGSQTSPVIVKNKSLQRAASFDSRLTRLPENSQASLHSELLAVGSELSDQYDSDVLLNGDSLSTDNSDASLTKHAETTGLTTSTTSLTESDQQLANAKFFTEQSSKSLTNGDSSNIVEPSLYIACEDYDPRTMSPNPDKEVELGLKKGDYVYVYGDEGSDGFFVGRLIGGAKGLVPSNYVKKLSDHSVPASPSRRAKSVVLPPPRNLELNRQFVDKETNCYCLSVCWEHPPSLPVNTRGYNVYVNNILDSTVPRESESSVLLSDIPRNQYTRVSVRTVDYDGNESADPSKAVEINLQFPIPPDDLTLQTVPSNSSAVRLMWPVTTPTSPRSDVPPVNSYKVYLNKTFHLVTTPTHELIKTGNMVGVELSSKDFNTGETLVPDDISSAAAAPYYLTVQSCNDLHDSSHSVEVPLSTSVLSAVLMNGGGGGEDGERTSEMVSSEASLLSTVGDEETHTSYSSSQFDNEGVDEVIIGGFYKALYSYDPESQSPNTEGVEEELGFEENDIIQAIGSLDEDGFFMGEKEGERGLVPKNMVEHINEMSTTLIADINHNTSSTSSSSHLLDSECKLVQALYDYNPFTQSKNPNPEEELGFKEGDYIYVRSVPSEDGFYEGELKGRSGLVPMTFVKGISSSDIIDNIDYKLPSMPSYDPSPVLSSS